MWSMIDETERRYRGQATEMYRLFCEGYSEKGPERSKDSEDVLIICGAIKLKDAL